jgi:glutathione-regulated potassium-efflux system ancillary protein KefC
MATTPLCCSPTTGSPRARQARARADTIDRAGPVIIAGFGRFGQIVGRLLFANDMRAVVLDHDPDQVESLRKFGYRVFYGDATRLDLLEARGARTRLLVNAIDDVEASLALVDRVRANFPNLPIVSRARNVTHYSRAQAARRGRGGARDLRGGACALAARRSRSSAWSAYRARELADRFRRHNIQSVDATMPFYQDEARRMSMAKSGREELEQQFARDRERFERSMGEWRMKWQRQTRLSCFAVVAHVLAGCGRRTRPSTPRAASRCCWIRPGGLFHRRQAVRGKHTIAGGT